MDLVVGAKTEWIHCTYLFITAAGNHRVHSIISRISTEQLRAHFVRSPIIVRLLKAWEVTVVRTECDDAALPCIPIRSLMFALTVATHIIVGLLKYWKVTVVRTDPCRPSTSFQEGPHKLFFHLEKNNKKAKMKKRARLDD